MLRLIKNPTKSLITTNLWKIQSSTFGDVPKNVLAEQNLITAHQQAENGKVYDKRPFKITLEGGKKYAWCLCGQSKSNPMCDGTHKNVHLKITLRPVKFMVEKSGDYWLCQCKHTKNRPFCDGTHKTPAIADGK